MKRILLSLLLTILTVLLTYSYLINFVETTITNINSDIIYVKAFPISPSISNNTNFNSNYIPTKDSKTNVVISTSDNRLIALRKFLSDKNSPLYPYAEVIISEADRTGLDWRLIVSISGVESNFGRVIPNDSYNAWGWKGDPTRDWSYFTNWKDGIMNVTSGLSYWYGTSLTPFEIEPAYCPPCGEDANHAWANGVQYNMNLLNYYYNNLENK